MKTRLLFAAAAMAGAAFLAASPAMADENFDNPVATSPTQAPNTWYTDRYAPADFTAGVAFDGRQVLQVEISPSDSATNRPGAYSSSFYNTQGRKLDLADGVTSMSIELYVDEDWGTTNSRMAGFWGTGFSETLPLPGNDVYPIIEFASNTDYDGAGGRFRGWDRDSGWISMGLPTGFTYGGWYTLDITLSGGNWIYSVGDASLSVNAYGAPDISNVILQGHNTTQGVEYAIRWDNLTTTAVPEPGTWALMITGFGMAGAMLRRRRSAGALA